MTAISNSPVNQDLDLEAAAALAAEFYYCPDAATILIRAATSSQRSEERYRALSALRVLAFAEEVRDLVPPPRPEWAEAVGLAAVELALYIGHGANRRERERVATLLRALCCEALRVRALREGEAA